MSAVHVPTLVPHKKAQIKNMGFQNN